MPSSTVPLIVPYCVLATGAAEAADGASPKAQNLFGSAQAAAAIPEVRRMLRRSTAFMV
jgi:hypothetical protein